MRTIKPVPDRNHVGGAVWVLRCERRDVTAFQQVPNQRVRKRSHSKEPPKPEPGQSLPGCKSHQGIDRGEPKSYLHGGTFENRRYLLATRSMSVMAISRQLRDSRASSLAGSLRAFSKKAYEQRQDVCRPCVRRIYIRPTKTCLPQEVRLRQFQLTDRAGSSSSAQQRRRQFLQRAPPPNPRMQTRKGLSLGKTCRDRS